MEKELVDKIMEKQFMELTSSERESLTDWCLNEDEFDQLKHVFSEVEKLKADQIYTPKAETKKSLDDLFAKEHSKIKPVIWYNSLLMVLYPTDKPAYRRPLIQLAALGLIFLLATPFLFKDNITVPTNQVAQIETEKNEMENSSTNSDLDEPIVETKEDNRIPEVTINDEVILDMPNSFAVVANSGITTGVEPSSAFDFTSTLKESEHPDGIFIGASAVAYSQPASAEPAIFDLLTAAF